MADYDKALAEALKDLGNNPDEKNGAKKYLGGLKAAMNIASALNVPFAGTARMLIDLADASMAGLDGNADAINLDSLFVVRATDALKDKGISTSDIDRIRKGQ